MGGSKQSYIITFTGADKEEIFYLVFGNGTYAKDIFKALGVYYETCGYEQVLDDKDWTLTLTKKQPDGTVIESETILFRMYQKQLMWRGQLPKDIAFLDDYIPEHPVKPVAKLSQAARA